MRRRLSGGRLRARGAALVVLELELARVLAHDGDVLPAEPLEALPRDVAERG